MDLARTGKKRSKNDALDFRLRAERRRSVPRVGESAQNPHPAHDQREGSVLQPVPVDPGDLHHEANAGLLRGHAPQQQVGRHHRGLCSAVSKTHSNSLPGLASSNPMSKPYVKL